jgi:hypothetical protein
VNERPRKTYDGFADAQKAGGVTRQSVFRSTDDPNTVLITHSFATAADAEKFLASPSCAMACSKAASRASRESRSTRTPSPSLKPGSPP